MSTLTRSLPIVNPAAVENPRDSWPAWTDADRWEPTPDERSEEPRPTCGPDFTPSPEDQAGAVFLLNAKVTDYWPDSWPDLMEVCTVSDWDYHAELADEAERIASGPYL